MQTLIATLLSAVLAASSFAGEAKKLQPRDSISPGDEIIPIIILGGEWTTVIVLNNTNDEPVLFPVAFYNQDGPWSLPIRGVGTVSLYTVQLPPRGTLRLEFDYSSPTPAVGFGTANVSCNFGPGTYCAGVGVYSLLRNHNSARQQDFEVAYPLGSTLSGDPQHFLFDQSNFAQMVLNLTNYCTDSFCTPATVSIEIFDKNGNSFFTDSEDVQPGEVKILNFAQMSMATWNRVGMVRLSGVDNIVVSGHRINDTGSFAPLVSYNY